MSFEPTDQLMPEPDQDISKALVLLFRLSPEAVERINELMRNLHLRFEEAAVHMGVITQQELDDAVAWMRQRALRQGRSIVEEVLHRTARRRDVVLWQSQPVAPGERLILAHNPDHPRSEMIRSLRTELLMRSNGRRRAGVFALLSPCAAEGRSQLAAELAIAFAQLGRRTLLVDADMRRPSQHRLFGANQVVGLAQVLADDESQCVHSVHGIPEMALMTSGALPPNPLELLSGTRFERLMAEWRRTFEFVVFDTPPTSEFSDGLAVATAAGNVLVLGRAAMTSFGALNEMCRKLQTTQARVLGAVINKF